MSNLYRGPSIDASYQVSVHMAEGFQRRRLKCEKLTDDRRRTPSDGKSSHCLWQGELKRSNIYTALERLKNEKTKMMNQLSSQIDQYHYFRISEWLLFNAMLVILSYSTAQRENTKSASFQGLLQRRINEKSVCIRGRSAKQHGHDGQNAMSSRGHHGL
jgi:hypothetical protein